MADAFKASVITPEAMVLEASVTAAQVPVFDGLIGIMNHRAPLLAKMGTGVLRLDTKEGVQRFMVSGGYVQMKGEELTILTTEAVPAGSVTGAMIAAEEAKLNAVAGEDLKAMEARKALSTRICAMKAAKG